MTVQFICHLTVLFHLIFYLINYYLMVLCVVCYLNYLLQVYVLDILHLYIIVFLLAYYTYNCIFTVYLKLRLIVV